MMKISNAKQLLAAEAISTQEQSHVKGGLTLSGSIGGVQGSLSLTSTNLTLSYTKDGATTTLSWDIADDDKRRERPGGVQTQ